MAEASWVKLGTNLPDHRKIKRIRKMPDGNNIVLFWVFLLARAGECNHSGGLYLTETLPYAAEDLAADFDFSVEFIEFALLTLEKYAMITTYDDVIFIKNWESYQAAESLEKIREQNRLRQAKHREKQKLLAVGNVTGHTEITGGNALDKELDKEKESKRKKSYGEFQNVLLTDSELEKLSADFPDYQKKIESLSIYIGSTGKSYKSHYLTILSWARKEKDKQQPKQVLDYVDVPEAFRR